MAKGAWRMRKAGVAAGLRIRLWPAEALDQESAEAVLGPGQVPVLVHGAQEFVPGHPPVERGDEPAEAVFADELVHLVVGEVDHVGG